MMINSALTIDLKRANNNLFDDVFFQP